MLVVGGGGEGNGRAITRELARWGAAVAVVDIDPLRAAEAADEIVSQGGQSVGITADVRDSGAGDQMVAETVEALGGVDVLVTVVGGSTLFVPWAPLDETTDDSWDLIFDLNLRYVFRVARAVVRQFTLQGTGGSIVSVGSISGSVATSPMSIAYGAAKAGLVSFAKTLSVEYGRQGVRMNVVSCGIVETPASAGTIQDSWKDLVPMGRAATTEDVARLVAFLASPLSNYVSGQNVALDGALTLRAQLPFPRTDSSMAG